MAKKVESSLALQNSEANIANDSVDLGEHFALLQNLNIHNDDKSLKQFLFFEKFCQVIVQDSLFLGTLFIQILVEVIFFLENIRVLIFH